MFSVSAYHLCKSLVTSVKRKQMEGGRDRGREGGMRKEGN